MGTEPYIYLGLFGVIIAYLFVAGWCAMVARVIAFYASFAVRTPALRGPPIALSALFSAATGRKRFPPVAASSFPPAQG